jgi:uncharacterized membrane protein
VTAVRVVHIVAGSAALLSGYAALYAAKGAVVHRRSGRVFVYAMIAMTLTGAAMAAVGKSEGIVINAFLTSYLVITALITVSRPAAWSVRADVGLAMVAFGLGLASLALGFETVMSPTGRRDGLPPFPYFMYGVIGVLGGLGDVRMIRVGGLIASSRIARHLWRMCWALWIAAASFFWGQAKVIAEPIRIIPLLSVPVLAVLVTMLYWLWRVRIKRSLRGIVRAGALEPTRIDPAIPARP